MQHSLLNESPAASHGAALLRVSLGTMWLAHALLKVFVFTIPGFAGFLASQGFPAVLAWPVVLAELIGGIAIIAGFYGRYVSIALLPILAGAFLTHLPNGWVFSAEGGGWEYPLFLMVASVVHFLIGDGAYAVARGRALPLLQARA